jgi:hypothetical protein
MQGETNPGQFLHGDLEDFSGSKLRRYAHLAEISRINRDTTLAYSETIASTPDKHDGRQLK